MKRFSSAFLYRSVLELLVYPGYTLKQIDEMLTVRTGSKPGLS